MTPVYNKEFEIAPPPTHPPPGSCINVNTRVCNDKTDDDELQLMWDFFQPILSCI